VQGNRPGGTCMCMRVCMSVSMCMCACVHVCMCVNEFCGQCNRLGDVSVYVCVYVCVYAG